MSTASSTDGSSRVVAIGPVWPPPSPPCTITASAPQPATFLACLAKPTDGITTTPASLSLAIRSGLGAKRERRHLDAFADEEVDAVDGVAGVGADVDAERLVRGGLHLADGGLQFVERHRGRGQDAEAARVGRRRHQPRPATQPMPVWTTGCSMPISSVSGVRSLAHARDLFVPQRLRVDHVANQLQFFGGGQPRLLGLAESVDLERGVLADLVGIDAGVQRHRAHRVVGAAEVEDAEVRHHPVDVDEPVRRVIGIDFVPTDPGHDVDVVAEDALGVVAHPIAGGMVDRVAGRTPHAEHLPARVLKGSERRQVLVAVPVDLVCAHHHVSAAPRQRLEDATERHPAFDRSCGAERGRIGEEPGLAVGEQDVGGERQACQSRADRHHVGHRADHDLTRVAEQLGTRDGTDLCAGYGDHFIASCASANSRTAAW